MNSTTIAMLQMQIGRRLKLFGRGKDYNKSKIDATNQGLDMFGVFKHGRKIAQQSQDEVTNIVNYDEDDDDDVTY